MADKRWTYEEMQKLINLKESGKTYRELGELYSLSFERVRQVYLKAKRIESYHWKEEILKEHDYLSIKEINAIARYSGLSRYSNNYSRIDFENAVIKIPDDYIINIHGIGEHGTECIKRYKRELFNEMLKRHIKVFEKCLEIAKKENGVININIPVDSIENILFIFKSLDKYERKNE